MNQTLIFRVVFLYSFFLLGLGEINGQQYSFKGYSINEGLPNASVNVILQDSRNFIWIGTEGGGLCRYNGYDFYTFDQEKNDIGVSIKSMVESKDGRIFIGTEKGIFIFNGSGFQKLDVINDFRSVEKLFVDQQGCLWILTANEGLFVHNFVDNEHDDELIKLNLPDSVPYSDITEDDYGRFWVVSGNGILVLSKEQPYVEVELGVSYEIPKVAVSCIHAGKEHQMWVGFEQSGAMLLSYDSLSCFSKRTYNSYFDNISDKIVSLAVDNSKNIWLATADNGVVYVDYPFLYKLNHENGLESNQITDVLEDVEGNIWIATRGHGLQVFSGWHFEHYGTESGLFESSIQTVAQDVSGYLWCSGPNGMYRLMRSGGRLNVSNVLLPEDYSQSVITEILFSKQGDIYLGTQSEGLIGISGNKIYSIGSNEGLPAGPVKGLLLENDSLLWVATQKGIAKLVGDSVLDLTSEFPEDGMEFTCIEASKTNGVWIGSATGLYCVRNIGIIQVSRADGLNYQNINALQSDEHGYLWIGVMGGGLYYLEEGAPNDSIGQVKPFLSGQELVSGNVYSLDFLNDSTLLVGTDKGANRINLHYDRVPHRKAVYSYNISNGFINQECSQGGLLVDQEGYAWFATKSGLTCYVPDKEMEKNKRPKIYLTGLEVNFEDVKWQSKEHGATEWFSFPEGMKLKYNENYVNFTYSGIYFSEGLQYQYFLEGWDKGWSLPTTQRVIGFSSLSPGKYTFNVKAVTKSGSQSTPATFSFTVKPPFWQTWWFIVIVVALSILAIVLLIRYRERKLKHDKEVLEETVKQRTHEISEQKTHIERQKKELTDSIEYAKNIQDAVLSQPQNIDKYLKEYFVVYLPRDIVSGDFYWFGEVDSKFVFSVADCTGHGVPGAFMSMLGIRLLNEIVLEKNNTDPDEILNQLRDGVVHALKQDSDNSDSKDGMDISLCVFDPKERAIFFAGAYNPLWLLRNGELIIYKADRMPVAIYDNLRPFTAQKIDCQPGDQFYIFSDGYADQFGGDDLSKFKPRRLRELITSIESLSAEDQKSKILEEFYSWKGEGEQIDDVTLMGVRI